MIRVAMLSYWHVHSDEYTNDVQQNPETEVAYIWDEDAARGQKKAEELGVPFVADIDELLAKDDVQAVVCDAPTTMHTELLVKAAKAGKHIFTEKVVTETNAGLAQVLDAVDGSGVVLVASLPRLYHNYCVAIDQLIADGRLGQITNVKVRLSHNGALDGWLPEHFFDPKQTAGGALIDLGCHPAYLATRWIGGLPETVAATYSSFTGKQVEDSAVAVLHHSSGAIGLAEAGFANRNNPFEIEIHGTDASLFFGTPEPKLQLVSGRDQIEQIELPEDKPRAFTQFVDAINNGKESVAENLEAAIWLTQVMDAANRSHAEGGSAVKVEPVR